MKASLLTCDFCLRDSPFRVPFAVGRPQFSLLRTSIHRDTEGNSELASASKPPPNPPSWPGLMLTTLDAGMSWRQIKITELFGRRCSRPEAVLDRPRAIASPVPEEASRR